MKVFILKILNLRVYFPFFLANISSLIGLLISSVSLQAPLFFSKHLCFFSFIPSSFILPFISLLILLSLAQQTPQTRAERSRLTKEGNTNTHFVPIRLPYLAPLTISLSQPVTMLLYWSQYDQTITFWETHTLRHLGTQTMHHWPTALFHRTNTRREF